MSLLRFIRRDREEKRTAVVAPPPEALVLTPPPAPKVEVAAPTPAPVDLDRIRRELEAISKIVGAGETMFGGTARAALDAREVEFKLGQIINLCRAAFKNPDTLLQASDTIIQVPVPELYTQLAKGKVTTKLALLVADIPPDHLSDYAVEHSEDDIPLPLNIVVASVQPDELRKRTASQERDLGDRTLPNLFTPASIAKAAAEAVSPAAPFPVAPFAEESAAAPAAAEAPAGIPAPEAVPAAEPAPVESVAAPAPVVEEPVAEPVAAMPEIVEIAQPVAEAQAPAEPVAAEISEPEPEPEPVVEAAPQEAPVADPEPAPVAAAAELSVATADEGTGGFRVMLGGIDLNRASAEEIHARLNGVGLKLAQRIVAVRTEGGLFTDPYDLARVPGLRTRRFEQVTGLPWNAAYFRHREQVKMLIGTTEGTIPDVRQVATRFAEISDFAGCMVIDEDGSVLAQSWNHPAAEALGAFAPQMFKKIHRYVKPLKLGEMNSLCFFVGQQPITVVRGGRLYIAALHRPDKLTKKQVTLVQALTMELGRRFAGI